MTLSKKLRVLSWTDQYFIAVEGQTLFTPTEPPLVGCWIFLNGLKQRAGAPGDYTLVGNDILFNFPLSAGSLVEIIQ